VADAFTASAREKIEAAGGFVQELPREGDAAVAEEPQAPIALEPRPTVVTAADEAE
jgi:hypothetical protein